MKMYHYAVIDKATNIVTLIGSRPEPLNNNNQDEFYVELDFHNPLLIGMKYENNAFVENNKR